MPDIIPLSRSAERARAAQMLHTATAEPLVVTRAAVLLTEILLGRLDRAGVDRDGARAVLAALWADRQPAATPSTAGGRLCSATTTPGGDPCPT